MKEITYSKGTTKYKEYLDSYLDKIGKSMTSEYLEYLDTLKPPFDAAYIAIDSLRIDSLVHADYYNSYCYDLSKGGLGLIDQYSNEGEYIQSFDNLYDILKTENASDYVYDWECYREKNHATRIKENFFGYSFLPLYNQKSYKRIYTTVLNCEIREHYTWLNGAGCRNEYNKQKDLSFDEYVDKLLKYWSNMLSYSCIVEMDAVKKDFIDTQKDISEPEYKEGLKALLNRYTYEDKILFHKVTDLSAEKAGGIYVLCFDGIKGYYIGKADKLNRRVKSHFMKFDSRFDRWFGQRDVTDIYVMPCSEKMNLYDLEIDCIAAMEEKLLFNYLPGGDNAIISIHSEEYKEAKGNLYKKRQKNTILRDTYEYQTVVLGL